MFYRATSFALRSQSIRFTNQYNRNILQLTEQISSGTRIHRPSDDPLAYRQITSLTARLNELRAEDASLKDSESKLNHSVSLLTEVNNLFTTAKQLTQQGITALSQDERDAMAVEVDSLLNSLQDIAQTKTAGFYLYSGTRSDVKPFEFSQPPAEGQTLQVNYRGASQNSRSHIGESISVDTLYAGDAIFQAPERSAPILEGDSGAAIGSGTPNLIGRATLTIAHTSTTFTGASGVAPGASSADGDTLIGPAGVHSLTIHDTSGNGSAGTISLNGGEEIPYTNADTDLKVVDPNGQVIYVDLSSIAAGFNGTVDVIGDGTLSVDGGATTVPIDFSASQTITDSTTGRFVHIDSQDIVQTGEDYLEFPGTSDAFQILYELSQDLRNVRHLDDSQVAESLDRRLGELSKMSNHILDMVGLQSASLQSLSQLDFRIQDLQLETETRLSNLSSTDIGEAVLRLKNEQQLLEYTYRITADIASTSLIDFLR